jgi:hypothetical protein
MAETGPDELLARLEQLEMRCGAAERRAADLEDEMTEMRAARLQPAPTSRRIAAAPGQMSRGQFLRLTGAAAAGAAVAGSVLQASPAAANSGTMIYGAYNFPGSSTTGLSAAVSGPTLELFNGGGGEALLAKSSTSNGVHGVAGTAGAGVWGEDTGSTGGVAGSSVDGYGVEASSVNGVSLRVDGGGRVLQTLRPAGAPTTGPFTKGEQIRDANGELWLCVASGTPGTWRRAATVKEGFQGGSVNLLSKPIRLYDSRTGAKLAGGGSVDIQVTGVVVGGVSVPAGAVGVVGNVTVTETVAPSGYLTLYGQGSPPSPATANVNWFAANQNLNTAAVVALNPANGKLTIHNGIAGGSNPTHVVFDAAGFVF